MGTTNNPQIRVAELFAGVAGFRLGLEYIGTSRKLSGRKKNNNFRVIWSNQFEPKTSKQHASDIYVKRFKLTKDNLETGIYWNNNKTEKHVNRDINHIAAKEVPEHDMLVAGFPCQDYSVMRALSREVRSLDGTVSSGEKGIEGPKGELWWQIARILEAKRPEIVFLENVPRLLSSPAIHKGQNFAIVIRSLIKLGYDVEWRTINAADYGMPQARKRVFILAYKRDDSKPTTTQHISSSESEWLNRFSPFVKAFPYHNKSALIEEKSLPETFDSKPFFHIAGIAKSNLENSCINVVQLVKPKPAKLSKYPLIKSIKKELSKEELEKYSIPLNQIDSWYYLKGTQRNEFRIKSIARDSIPEKSLEIYDRLMKEPKVPQRQTKWNKHRQVFLELVEQKLAYRYNIGAMRFPDHTDDTSRTIVTSEGGRGPARTRHIIKFDDSPSGYRRLMPIELERLNQFPDNWTHDSEISDSRRGFLMGNALVVGVVERLSGPIVELFSKGVE
jgi:DNA (cytosine-5)-methyltransferase 1